jgi:hypothetical protein
MVGEPQGAMRVASQIWQVVFASQTLPVFCLALRKKAQYVVVQVWTQYFWHHHNFPTLFQKAMFSKDDAFCVSLSPLLLTVFTPSHKNAPNISTISTTQNRLERIAIDLNKLNYKINDL